MVVSPFPLEIWRGFWVKTLSVILCYQSLLLHLNMFENKITANPPNQPMKHPREDNRRLEGAIRHSGTSSWEQLETQRFKNHDWALDDLPSGKGRAAELSRWANWPFPELAQALAAPAQPSNTRRLRRHLRVNATFHWYTPQHNPFALI